MIKLNTITFSYPGCPPLFQDYSWQANKGQAWAVLGPSGCGKTSLLYLLAGLRLPTKGQVLVDQTSLVRPRPQTGLILQDFGLLPWNTVFENASLGLRIRQLYGPDGKHAPQETSNPTAIRDLVHSWLMRLGLQDHIKQYPGQLSGGQRQRVAIARTLVLQPDVLLMDEPFSSLDAATRHDLRELTLNLWREQGFTFVVVTHSIEEAAHLGQFILVLGAPPHQQPEVITNPCFGYPELDDHPDYRALLRKLRSRLAEIAPSAEV